MRFKISWRDLTYRVSVPNYDGGEVVTLDEVEQIQRDLYAARTALARLKSCSHACIPPCPHTRKYEKTSD